MRRIALLAFFMVVFSNTFAAQISCPDFNTAKTIIGNASPDWNFVEINGTQWIYGGVHGKLSASSHWNHVAVVGSTQSTGGSIVCYATVDRDGPMLEVTLHEPINASCNFDGQPLSPRKYS